MVDDHHRVALGELRRFAERQRRDVERHDRAHEAEPGDVIVADDARRQRASLLIDDAHLSASTIR